MKTTLLVVVLVAVALAARHTLHSRSKAPADWTKIGRPAASDLTTFWVALVQKNVDVMKAVLEEVSDPSGPEYGNHWSYKQIQELVRPDAEVEARVTRWLIDGGVNPADIVLTGDSISVTSTMKIVEGLFQAKYELFARKATGQKVAAMIGSWSIPAEIAADIDMVTGLSFFPLPPRRTPVESMQTTAASSGYSGPSDYTQTSLGPGFWPLQGKVVPSVLHTLYNIPAGLRATNPKSSVAALEFQYVDCFNYQDMETYQTNSGVQFTNISVINKTDFHDNSGQVESVLDLQCMLGIASGANVVYWGAVNWIYEWSQQYLQLDNAPLIASLSYGWMEDDQCAIGECTQLGVSNSQYVERCNTELGKLGLMGYTIVVCTQDEGAPSDNNGDCQNRDHPVSPIYPATCPYALAVGATALLDASSDDAAPAAASPICSKVHCSRGTKEVTAQPHTASFTSGGGFSDIATAPKWQTTAVANWFASNASRPAQKYFRADGRAYPDVSAVGENIYIYSNGAGHFSGGTSAATPIFAAVLTLLNDWLLNNNQKPLGMVAPLLYQMAATGTGFNDITVGNNSCTAFGPDSPCCKDAGYEAVAGWDPSTGLGTPNFGEMLAYVKANVARRAERYGK